MGGDALFGYLIHPAGTDLHLDPFIVGSLYGDMQALVPIAFSMLSQSFSLAGLG